MGQDVIYGVGNEPGEEPDCGWGAAIGQEGWDEESSLVEVKRTIDAMRENPGRDHAGRRMP